MQRKCFGSLCFGNPESDLKNGEGREEWGGGGGGRGRRGEGGGGGGRGREGGKPLGILGPRAPAPGQKKEETGGDQNFLAKKTKISLHCALL